MFTKEDDRVEDSCDKKCEWQGFIPGITNGTTETNIMFNDVVYASDDREVETNDDKSAYRDVGDILRREMI